MMENIKFSVIIPVYNAESFIEKCLESVRLQDYKNYEVILVNDGSTDDSEKVIETYKSTHPEMVIIYVAQDNKGSAVARGNGLLQASGEFVAFLDADDIWYSNKLSVNYQYIQKAEGTFFYNDEYEVAVDGSKRRLKERQLGDNPIIELITESNPIATSTVVVERELLMKGHTFFDGRRTGEDIACWVSLAREGARFVYIPEILGEYRRNEKSLTMDNEEYMQETYSRLLEFYDLLLNHGYSSDEIEQLKLKQRARNNYSMARFYHRKKQFNRARQYYLLALKLDKKNKKAYLGVLLTLLRIKK